MRKGELRVQRDGRCLGIDDIRVRGCFYFSYFLFTFLFHVWTNEDNGYRSIIIDGGWNNRMESWHEELSFGDMLSLGSALDRLSLSLFYFPVAPYIAVP
jgi:hypothetical protein